MINKNSEKPLSKQVFRGLSWSYASAIISGVLHMVSLSVLAHLLPPSEFGILGMALIFVSFAERIGQIGVGPAIVQKQDITDRQLRIAATTGILSGLAMYGIFYFLSPVAAAFFNEPRLISILRVLGVVFVLEGLGMVSDSRMQRGLRFKALMVVDNLSYLLGGCLLASAMAYYGYGVWALVWGLIATRLVKIAMLTFFEPQAFCFSFTIKEASPLLHFGVGFSLGRLLNFSALYGDNFVVGKLLGSEALGLYSRAYQLMTLPTTYFAQIIDRVLFPALSKKQDSLPHLRKAYFLSVDAVSLVSLPLSVFMFLASKELVLVVMGNQWTEMIPVLAILSLGVFCRTAYKSGDTLSRSLGAVYQHASRQVVYTAAVIIGSLVGGTLWGLEGVAAAVLLAVTINYLLLSQLSLKLLQSSWSHLLLSHLPGIWVACWIFVFQYPAEYGIRYLETNKYLSLCIISAVSAFAALLALATARGKCRSESLIWLAGQTRLGSRGKFGRLIERAVVSAEHRIQKTESFI